MQNWEHWKSVERTLTDFPLPACSRAKTSQECCLTERELHWLHRSVVLYVSRWPRARRRQKKWHDMPIGPIVSSRWLQWCWSTEAWSNFVKDQRTVKLYCSFFPSPSLKGPESGNSPGSFASYPFKTVLQMDRGKCLVLEHAHAIICAWSSVAQRLQIKCNVDGILMVVLCLFPCEISTWQWLEVTGEGWDVSRDCLQDFAFADAKPWAEQKDIHRLTPVCLVVNSCE